MENRITATEAIRRIDNEKKKSPSEDAWFKFLSMRPWHQVNYKTVNDENYQLMREIFDCGYRYGMSDYGRRDVMVGFCAKCSDEIRFSVPKQENRNDDQS